MTSNNKILELQNIVKHFGGAKALDGVSFDLYSGEVHTICGENGAGKSTLIKVLSGAHTPDSGKIFIDGNLVNDLTPNEMLKAVIATIYQENTLFLHLSVYENIFVGRELTSKYGRLDKSAMIAEAKNIITSLGADIDVMDTVSTLGGAKMKIVEIARAVGRKARVLVMDEPSSSFGNHEVDLLFDVMHRLRKSGAGIIFISHHLDEVYAISDRVTVIRDGQNISSNAVGEISNKQLIQDMVGRNVEQVYHHTPCVKDHVVLELKNASGYGFNEANLYLKKGEIVGIAGLVGAGRSELINSIFGKYPLASGQLSLYGKSVSINTPETGMKNGLCLITEDRKIDGLFLGQSCNDNIYVPLLTKQKNLLVKSQVQKNLSNHYVDQLSIKISSIEQPVSGLSGGNQQKIILAKWMATNPSIFLFDEPTRGIDVGAKEDVYLELQKLIESDKSILIVSSEITELMGLCDRVYVMKAGTIVNELVDEEITEHNILESAL